MQNARENLTGLWGSHKGLVLLLFVGLTISLLAVMAPQSWATPSQSPLKQTTTNIVPEKPDCFRACDEPIYLRTTGDGFTVTQQTTVVDVYVTENVTWTTGLDVSSLTVYHQTQVTLDANGHFDPNPALIWADPLVDPGFYDVFFDVGGTQGVFDDSDGVINPFGPENGDLSIGAGFCVVPCPVGGATVPRAVGLMTRWVALGVLVVSSGGAAFLWARRRNWV